MPHHFYAPGLPYFPCQYNNVAGRNRSGSRLAAAGLKTCLFRGQDTSACLTSTTCMVRKASNA